MIINNEPINYKPISKLNFCGNELESVRYPLVMQTIAPFLIGLDDQKNLEVWLTGFIADQWKLLVEANKSLHPNIKVRSDLQTIKIFLNASLLLNIKKDSEESAVITDIDLHPIGLKVKGLQDTLFIGSNKFVNNKITNCSVGIFIE